MKLKVLLSVTGVYLAILGLGFMFFPLQIGRGAVPPDAPQELVSYLRVFGGPLLGIAVLNWTARTAQPSTALNSIILGNIVGFTAGPLMDVWGLLTAARSLAVVFMLIHLLIAFALRLGLAHQRACGNQIEYPAPPQLRKTKLTPAMSFGENL